MRTTFSAKSVALLFSLRFFGAVGGLAVGLFVLTKVHSRALVSETVLTLVGVGMLLFVVVALARSWRLWRRLKVVSADERSLYVSDYGGSRESAIPLSDILKVTQWRGKGIRPVTVHLRSASQFGGRILFQPRRKEGQFHWAVQEDEVVKDLRQLAGANE